jgi:hypothetical protein
MMGSTTKMKHKMKELAPLFAEKRRGLNVMLAE